VAHKFFPSSKPWLFRATNRPFRYFIFNLPERETVGLFAYLLFIFYITLGGRTGWRLSQFCDALVISQIVFVVCGYIPNESRAARSRVGSSKLLRLI
jgi:hypothetical protein